MASLLSTKQFERLHDSITWSELQFGFARDQRILAINQFVGAHYAEGGSDKRSPVPHLKMAVDIFRRKLVPQSPRALITTWSPDHRVEAYNLELAVNQIPDEIDLTATLRRFVTEALFFMGVLKVGLHEVGTAMGHPYGRTFVDNVTADDYFCDMSAKRFDQIQYEGNSYWLNYEDVMEAGWLKKKDRDIGPDDHTVIGPAGERRAEGIATQATAEVYKKRIWLRDVWLPDERLLVTYGITSKRILNVIERDEPEEGPYIKLGFCEVPGNLLPLPPVATWVDLDELGNSIYRKLANQADSEKTVLGFDGSDNEGVQEFKKACDVDGITFHGRKPEILHAGGVNQTTLAFWMQNKELASYVAGNTDALGGLQPQTQTVGQDKLLSEAAGAQMQDMSAVAMEAMRKVFEALAYYEYNDPVRRRNLEKPIEGTDITIPTTYGPENRQSNFDLFDLRIDLYSLQDSSPTTKLQKLGAIMGSYIVPLAPLIEKAGGTINVQEILSDVARFSDMPEVERYVAFMEPNELQAQRGGSKSGGMPANTTRTYERVGRPGMSPQGASAVTQQMLLGKGMQDSEAAQARG